MEDSRRQGSFSRFLQRQSKNIRFSVDAFLLPQVTGTQFYLRCTISVQIATSATAKSCTYNNAKRRWDELYTDATVCACCDSTCEIEATSSLPHMTKSLITSPWVWDKNEQSITETNEGWVNVEELKCTEEICEEDGDDDALEIVTDINKQMEAKGENKKMPMEDLDEDVEVIFGTEETADGELNDEGDHSGKVMSVGEQKDRAVMFEEDAGRLKSADDGYSMENVTDTEKEMDSKEENQKMLMKDLDENVEAIVGTEETTDRVLNDEGYHSGIVMSVVEQMDRAVAFEEDAGSLKSVERIGEEEEGAYTVATVSDTEKHMQAKKENEKMPLKYLDENADVIVETRKTSIELNDDEGDRSREVMPVGELMDRAVELEDDTLRTKQSSVHLLELLEDGNDDKGSSKSGQKELIDITREEMQPENFKNMHVQNIVPSHMVVDEEMFLNSKQEPMEWMEMNSSLPSEREMRD